MKKIISLLVLSFTFMFASMNLQTASKSELMSIKGIGAKKAEAIIKYRKSHKLKSADDLLKVKGIGKGIVKNVKNDVKVATTKKKSSKIKRDSKKKVSKVNAKKTSKTTTKAKNLKGKASKTKKSKSSKKDKTKKSKKKTSDKKTKNNS